MFITVGCIWVLVVGLICMHLSGGREGLEIAGGVGSVFAGVGVFICLILIIVAPIFINGQLADYHSLNTSLSLARDNQAVSSIELAAIQTQVIEFNRKLAVKQYWAKNPLTNWFYSKKIFEMKPIR